MRRHLFLYVLIVIFCFDLIILPMKATAQDAPSEENVIGQQELPSAFHNSSVNQFTATAVSDLADLLVLYDSSQPTEFDPYFCALASFYGLLCKEVAINQTPLTPDLLRDGEGNYFKLIAASAAILNSESFDQEEIESLEEAIVNGGTHLFVAKPDNRQDLTVLQMLTQNALLSVAQVQDDTNDWHISAEASAVTKAFSGLTIISKKRNKQKEFALTISNSASSISLISGMDRKKDEFVLFAQMPLGAGSVFIDAGMSPGEFGKERLTELYFDTRYFSTVTPMMMAIQYAYGAEAWHNDQLYVNFTIDDPALQTVEHLLRQWKPMDYLNLLPQMQSHNFHTTIAWQPRNWLKSDPEIVELFINNPGYFSIVQHGNNHDGFEFYTYSGSRKSRPFHEQVADIQEGMARMAEHYQNTGIAYERVMIFPYGNGPVGTLSVLKQYDFLATVQGPATPLMASKSRRWDFDMYPANLDFANFPLVRRRPMKHPNDYDSILWAQNLFLHKPILLSSHSNPMFRSGMDAFNHVADQINELAPDIQWADLGNVLKRMYLLKLRDDGDMDVMMQTNNILLTNQAEQTKTYWIVKEETLNVPIRQVTVNGMPTSYTVADGLLQLGLTLPTGAAADIMIDYDETSIVAASSPVVEPLEGEEWIEEWEEEDAREDEDLRFERELSIKLFIPLISR